MLSGASSLLNEYYGLPQWAGRTLMLLLSLGTVLLGLEKLTDIIGRIGPVIIFMALLVSVGCLIQNPQGILQAVATYQTYGMEIQRRLLMEQIELMAACPLGKRFFGDTPPATIEEFRTRVPLTNFADYADVLLSQRDEMLPGKPVVWLKTTWEGGDFPHKCAPYTESMAGDEALGPGGVYKVGQRGFQRFARNPLPLCVLRDRIPGLRRAVVQHAPHRAHQRAGVAAADGPVIGARFFVISKYPAAQQRRRFGLVFMRSGYSIFSPAKCGHPPQPSPNSVSFLLS